MPNTTKDDKFVNIETPSQKTLPTASHFIATTSAIHSSVTEDIPEPHILLKQWMQHTIRAITGKTIDPLNS